ncbi:hypothetical protein D6789_00995 [Candidatus Woesearchaeota archaeon]|nr:MAG: hypothetical protein D6789_00995 [Candidatus Woesearchaeota archaeon]
MLVSIIGFFVSIFHIYPFWSHTWGFTFAVFFVMIFFASMVSMAGAGLNEEDLIELAVHDERVRRGEHRREVRQPESQARA